MGIIPCWVVAKNRAIVNVPSPPWTLQWLRAAVLGQGNSCWLTHAQRQDGEGEGVLSGRSWASDSSLGSRVLSSAPNCSKRAPAYRTRWHGLKVTGETVHSTLRSDCVDSHLPLLSTVGPRTSDSTSPCHSVLICKTLPSQRCWNDFVKLCV